MTYKYDSESTVSLSQYNNYIERITDRLGVDGK